MYVLIHSPLVGPLTWMRVADEMRARGLAVLVPTLEDSSLSKDPFWKQHAESIAEAISEIPGDTPVILVAHSGAGALLPAVGASILNPVRAYIFVDAGIPRDGLSRLDLMGEFREQLEQGRPFPGWSFDDLHEVLPDLAIRKRMIVELRPRGLDFFTEPIPVFEGWPDAPCAYILFSPAYEPLARQAGRQGWIVEEIKAGHFHMLVDPSTVTDRIVDAVK
jgi:pimeloyl-ACP methyl ester carboxylesterase